MIRSAHRIALQPARQSFTSFNSPASNPSFNPYLNTGGYGASAQSYDTQVTAFGFRGATSASIDRTTDSHLANQARDTYEAGDYGLNVKIGKKGKDKGGKVEEKGKGAEGKGKERGERETKETQMQETIMSKTEESLRRRDDRGGGKGKVEEEEEKVAQEKEDEEEVRLSGIILIHLPSLLPSTHLVKPLRIALQPPPVGRCLSPRPRLPPLRLALALRRS